jgi:hypothetical protein
MALIVGKSAQVRGLSRTLYLNCQVGASIAWHDSGSAGGLESALERHQRGR